MGKNDKTSNKKNNKEKLKNIKGDMMKIVAQNSNLDVVLDIRRNEDETFSFCLYGEIDGDYKQIDFNEMSKQEFNIFVKKCIQALNLSKRRRK